MPMGKHPGLNPEHWYGDDKPLRPELSDVDPHDREAELIAGLAQRSYSIDPKRVAKRLDELAQRDAKHYSDIADELDRRFTWQQLYDMFKTLTAVSNKKATEWADRICERGVQRK